MKKLMLMAVAATAFAGTVATTARRGARDAVADFTAGPRDTADRMADAMRGGPVLVIGQFYGGRGYWDGRRYYQHRVRHNNGWRYR